MDAWQIYIDLNHCLDKLLEKVLFQETHFLDIYIYIQIFRSHFNWNKARMYSIISDMNTDDC